MFGERVLFPYCPSFLGVWWKCPISPLGCPGPCPLSLSIPVLPLIVIYCSVLSLYCPLLSLAPFIVHYYSLLSLYCPLLSLDCLFDIHIVLNCPSYSHIALDCPIFSLIALKLNIFFLTFPFVPIRSHLLYILCPVLYYPLSIDPIIDIYSLIPFLVLYYPLS